MINQQITYDPKMPIVNEFKKSANFLLHLSFPQLTYREIDMAIDFSVAKYIQDHDIKLDNSYTHEEKELTLLDITNYVIEKKPIVSSSGVLFKRHGEVINLIYKLLDGFINDRKAEKKEMFKYPKGSEMYNKHNLSQLLLKIKICPCI